MQPAGHNRIYTTLTDTTRLSLLLKAPLRLQKTCLQMALTIVNGFRLHSVWANSCASFSSFQQGWGMMFRLKLRDFSNQLTIVSLAGSFGTSLTCLRFPRQKHLSCSITSPGISVIAATVAARARHCPVLLVSSRADKIWPAASYADEIAKRLAERGSVYTVQNLQFDDASHLLMGTGPGITKFDIPGTTRSVDFGGTTEGNTRARSEAWAATKQFLAAI